MTRATGNIVLLDLAAMMYLDWLKHFHRQEHEEAEKALEDVKAYKLELIAEMLKDMPHVSLQRAEAYVNGMLDGYLQAVNE